ncbi:MAG TPA: DUF2017 family protein [Gaiellaceae bacterium]|nr:DUF2017 family protein [Gaiellaceae bacterium]
MAGWGAPVTPQGDGRYRLRLGRRERGLVRGLCHELRGLVETGDTAVARLFPSAYRDDDEAAEEFARLVHPDLRQRRLDALDLVARTVDEQELDQAQAEAWCGALNDLRLVLGERLGVAEDELLHDLDPGDPRAPELALYGWLTYVQGSLVDALASRL